MVIGDQNELYHYGILGMKWGVRRFQPYSTTGGRKSGKGGKEIGEAAKHKMKTERLNRKVSKKLTKLGTKYDATSKKAERLREKAERKSLSVFATKKTIKKAHRKSIQAGRNVTRIHYKGKKYYNRMMKKMARKKMYMNKNTQAIGERFLADYMSKAEKENRSIMNQYITKSMLESDD